MPEIHYVPDSDGGLTIFAGEHSLLALQSRPEPAARHELWADLVSGVDHAPVLDLLLRTGLSSIPPFVLLATDTNGVHLVLVRGPIEIVVDGGETISGEGVSSWREARLPVGAGVTVWPSGVSPDATTLPLRVGIVLASAFRLGDLAVADAKVDSIAVASAAAPIVPATASPVSAPPQPVPKDPPTVDPEQTLASQTITVPPPPSPSFVAPPEDGGYDHLFGETVVRSVEDAAVREVADETAAAVVADVADKTEFVDRAALRERRRAARESTPEPDAPRLFLELSTGGTEYIDQPLVIGRAPAVERVPGANIPRPVVMTTPNQDISRTHAQISAQGGTAVVTDLHSSNGTLVMMPGKPAQKLRPGEPTAVIVGTVIDLGDGATLTVRQS